MPVLTPPEVRFTADEFQRMCDADLLGERRVELINGRIYRMPAQKDRHMTAISKINRLLSRVVPDHERLLCQGTLRIDDDTTVDPDFMWLDVTVDTPYRLWPLPLLVIEVSESTYKKDSTVKLQKYAMAGIRDYWIVNCKLARLEVYRAPSNPTGQIDDAAYREMTTSIRGQSVSPLDRPAVTFDVADLLP